MQNEVFILDSNIWISYVITKRLDKLVALIYYHHLTVITSRHLIAEIQEVLSRPKFKKYLKQSDIKELIAIHFGTWNPVKSWQKAVGSWQIGCIVMLLCCYVVMVLPCALRPPSTQNQAIYQRALR